MKLNLRKGQMSLTSWQLAIGSLAGVYRGDVTVDSKPIWRGLVKITP